METQHVQQAATGTRTHGVLHCPYSQQLRHPQVAHEGGTVQRSGAAGPRACVHISTCACLVAGYSAWRPDGAWQNQIPGDTTVMQHHKHHLAAFQARNACLMELMQLRPPCCSSSLATSTWPSLAANISGVYPLSPALRLREQAQQHSIVHVCMLFPQ